MLIDFALPKLAQAMDEGRIIGWAKREGDTLARGETLVEVETDKAAMEVPSPVDGVLREILAPTDTTVAVGAPLARIETAD